MNFTRNILAAPKRAILSLANRLGYAVVRKDALGRERADHAALRALLVEVEKQLETHKLQTAATTDAHLKLAGEHATLEAQHKATIAEFDRIAGEHATLTARLDSTEQQLRTATAELVEVEKQRETHETQIAATTDAHLKLAAEHASLEAQHKATMTEFNRIAGEHATLTARLSFVEEQLRLLLSLKYDEPHYILVKFIHDQLEEIKASIATFTPSSKKPLIVSIVLWGEKYTGIFLNYFIPSVLSPGNFPAVAEKRDIHLDLYLPASDWKTVRKAGSFAALRKYVTVNMAELPEPLARMETHANEGFKYEIYGDLHHVSVRRARLMNADVICIAPDGVHADGSYGKMVRYIDEGYKAVVFSSLRGQAETILPILDGMRDDENHVLTIPPRTLVSIVTKNIHHTFKNFTASEANRNFEFFSYVLYPEDHGLTLRAFHLHPIIMSSECIQKECPIDGQTMDAEFTHTMFPDPEDWKDIKIVTDSDDILMLDLTYAIADYVQPAGTFLKDRIADRGLDFPPIHRWFFSHTIHFRQDEAIDSLGSFDLEDGELAPMSFPLEQNVPVSHRELADYVAARADAERSKDKGA